MHAHFRRNLPNLDSVVVEVVVAAVEDWMKD